MAELNNLDSNILNNSSLEIVDNKTLSEGLPSPPVVPPLVDVIHGKVSILSYVLHKNRVYRSSGGLIIN